MAICDTGAPFQLGQYWGYQKNEYLLAGSAEVCREFCIFESFFTKIVFRKSL
jgi:hypothetical protein